MTLHDYGVRPHPVVREPAHDDDLRTCPECGQPVGQPSTWLIEDPDLADDVDVNPFAVRGWLCNSHDYDVYLPRPVSQGAPQLGTAWTTVRLRYSDTTVHPVAVPKQALEGSP